MKKFITLALMCFTLGLCAQVEWKPNITLQCSDFKAPPKVGSFIANTCSQIRIDPIVRYGKRYFLVRAMFLPDNSYMSPIVVDNDTIIKHEQTHFNITELYARKLRQAIDKYQGLNTREEYDAINKEFSKYTDAWGLAQTLYDAQTAHSTNYLYQKFWEEEVEVQLSALHDWELNPKSRIYNIGERL